MPTLRFKEYPNVTYTIAPLKILRPKIKNAYFAEATIEEVTIASETTTTQEEYTVVSGDTLSKIATKKGTTVAAIIASDAVLTTANQNSITVGQKITLPTTTAAQEKKKKISFSKIKTGTIAQELYVVVETEDFQGYGLSINVNQGKEKGIEEQDTAIMLQDDQGSYHTKITTKVGGMCDTDYLNKDDFADQAIFKVAIDSSDDKKKEAWQKVLKDATDKKTAIYILVDAHSDNEGMHINYYGRNKEADGTLDPNTSKRNQWLDMDGNWFELKGGCKFPITPEQLLEIFPESTKTRREEVATAINKYSDEFEIHNLDRMSHFLGQIGTETGQLKALQENYNYSAKNIYDTFLKKTIVIDSNSTTGYTFKYHDLIEGYDADLSVCEYTNPLNSSQKKYGHKRITSPIAVTKNSNGYANWSYSEFNELYSIKSSYTQSKTLFDYVYGCRMENGAKSTEDGSDYFGVGFIHLTGKSKYKSLHKTWNKRYPNDQKDFLGSDIALLKTNVDVAIKASMIIWMNQKLNSKSDSGNNDLAINTVGAIVNGSGFNQDGTPNAPNGQSDRLSYTKKAYEILSKEQ